MSGETINFEVHHKSHRVALSFFSTEKNTGLPLNSENGTVCLTPIKKTARKLKITHKLLRFYIPCCSGKVERSHFSGAEALFSLLRLLSHCWLRERQKSDHQNSKRCGFLAAFSLQLRCPACLLNLCSLGTKRHLHIDWR